MQSPYGNDTALHDPLQLRCSCPPPQHACSCPPLQPYPGRGAHTLSCAFVDSSFLPSEKRCSVQIPGCLLLFCTCLPLCAGALWPMPAWVRRDVRSASFLFHPDLHYIIYIYIYIYIGSPLRYIRVCVLGYCTGTANCEVYRCPDSHSDRHPDSYSDRHPDRDRGRSSIKARATL